MTDIINKWRVLRNLSKDFVYNIKSVYIFGRNGKQVIVITNDDKVYSFGDKDSYGCLGLGHTNAVQQPTKIEELCAKQVIHIEFSVRFKFIIALTLNGNVFSWGHNLNGELGIGNKTSQSKPTIISTLSDKNVIDIKSGHFHSLALTSCGDVYIWGIRSANIPIKMKFVSLNQEIIATSCGRNHALALTNTGIVFYWGKNRYGQCGNGRNNNSYVSKWRESLNTGDLYVKKVVCGPNHSMILSKRGNVFCFGRNNFGQCGDGTKFNRNNPTLVLINARIVDIAATKHFSISVALSNKGICYIWGKCGHNSIITPIEIPCNDMNKVLQHYSLRKVTFKPLVITNKNYESSSIMNRIADKFNKREFSDIAFKVEDKYIYAQKSYLVYVCKHFEAMFSDNNWIESNKSEIEIKNYSYSVYYAFIKYLYTNCVDINADEDALNLMDLANYYLEETLKELCVPIIKNLIKCENVFEIYYSAAVKYNSNELKAYCMTYIKNNFANETNIESIMDNAVKFTEKLSQNS